MARMKYDELKKKCDEYKAEAERNRHHSKKIAELRESIEGYRKVLEVKEQTIEQLEKMNASLDLKHKNRAEQVERYKGKLQAARDVVICTVGKIESIGTLAGDLAAELQVKHNL